jgi:hypothetical protein
MVDSTDIASHTLAILRRLDERTERMAEDLHDMKIRVLGVEANLAAMNGRMDRFETRLERMERRLELAHAPVQ